MGDTRHDFSNVERLYVPIAVAVLVVIALFLTYAIIRYRARPGHTAKPTKDRYAVDAVVAVVLALVAALLVTVTFRNNDDETALAKPGFRVDVLAFKWGWQFTYPSLPGVVDRSSPDRPAVLHVPADTTVQVSLRTRDVVHSFWIPDLRFKRDAWPRQTARFDLRFPGGMSDGVGHCAQFCGLKHSDMVFTVDAMPPSRLRAWEQSRPAGSRASPSDRGAGGPAEVASG